MIYRKRYHYLPDETYPCEKTGNGSTFIHCLKKDIIEAYFDMNMSCLPIHLDRVLKSPQFHPDNCNQSQSEQILKFNDKFDEILLQYARSDAGVKCSLPCQVDEISPIPNRFANNRGSAGGTLM